MLSRFKRNAFFTGAVGNPISNGGNVPVSAGFNRFTGFR
jgi:hypothetical protein